MRGEKVTFRQIRMFETFRDTDGKVLVKTGPRTATSQQAKQKFLFQELDYVTRTGELPKYFVKRRYH